MVHHMNDVTDEVLHNSTICSGIIVEASELVFYLLILHKEFTWCAIHGIITGSIPIQIFL